MVLFKMYVSLKYQLAYKFWNYNVGNQRLKNLEFHFTLFINQYFSLSLFWRCLEKMLESQIRDWTYYYYTQCQNFYFPPELQFWCTCRSKASSQPSSCPLSLTFQGQPWEIAITKSHQEPCPFGTSSNMYRNEGPWRTISYH